MAMPDSTYIPANSKDFLRWLTENPDGFVLASDKPSYNRIHRARLSRIWSGQELGTASRRKGVQQEQGRARSVGCRPSGQDSLGAFGLQALLEPGGRSGGFDHACRE